MVEIERIYEAPATGPGPRGHSVLCLPAWAQSRISVSGCDSLSSHQAFTEQSPYAGCCAQLRGKGVSMEECPGGRVRQAHTKLIPNDAENAIKGETVVTAILRFTYLGTYYVLGGLH